MRFLHKLCTKIGHYWDQKWSARRTKFVELTAQRELSDVVFHLLFFAVGLRPLMKTFCRDFLKIFEQMLGVFCDPQLRKRFQKYRRIMKRYRQCVCIIVCDKIPLWLGSAFSAAQSQQDGWAIYGATGIVGPVVVVLHDGLCRICPPKKEYYLRGIMALPRYEHDLCALPAVCSS